MRKFAEIATSKSLRLACAAAVAVALLPSAPAQAQVKAAGQEFVVVVNTANPTSTINKVELSKLFLKKVSTWQNGREVLPVDLPENSPVRDAFTKAVLKKSVSAVKSYWQQQIFSGRAVPPAEKASDSDVLAYLRANPNAIGYVSAGTPLGGAAKVVIVND